MASLNRHSKTSTNSCPVIDPSISIECCNTTVYWYAQRTVCSS